MTEEEKNIDEIFSRLEKKEKKFRYRNLTFIAVLFLGGAVWLWYTSSRVKSMQFQTKELETKNMVLNDSLKYKQEQVANIEEALHVGDNFNQYKVDLTPVDLKELSFGLGKPSKLFRDIKELQNRDVQFSLGGKSPNRGFNSITMMSFVLEKNNLIDKPYNSSRELMALINEGSYTKIRTPQSGDIILYEAGYCMLYVKTNKEFVVGMTPFGILELKPDFAKKVAIFRPNYNRQATSYYKPSNESTKLLNSLALASHSSF